jgi:hypothetical protein
MKYKPSLPPPVIPPISTASEEQENNNDNLIRTKSIVFLKNMRRGAAQLHVGAE